MKKFKLFILKAVVMLLVSRNLTDAEKNVTNLFTILLSEVNHHHTKKAMTFFKTREHDEEEFTNLLTEAAKVSVSPDTTASDALLKSSPYYLHFQVSAI